MWKVYDAEKVYQASCKEVELAAVIVAFLGDGATIRCDHTLILWTEGKEGLPASESYDEVAAVVHARLGAHRAALAAKRSKRAAELEADHRARRAP
jgi:hypothetical protein